MVDPSHIFHIADYIVFGITIVVSVGIGIYYAFAGDRQRTTSEYLVGGRTMKFIPVAISLIASFESSIMMLGLPAETYVYGIQYVISCCGYLVSQLLSVIIIVPLLHPLKITSAYEYLQLRFDSTAVRLLGSFLGMLSYVWYMGIVLFGPAIALEAVTGFSQWSSIFVVALVAVVYTAIGGLKAVIWTDVFQAFIMYAGMFAILIKGTIDVGGAGKVWNIAAEGDRMNFFNFDPDLRTRHTFWNLFFGSIIRGFGLAFNQSTVQRISATKTQSEARKVLLVAAPTYFISLSLAAYEGIVAYSYYQTVGCDPLESNKITDPNQIIPFTVMDIFQNLPGMPGLFLASLFSASLSTLSSGLSSLSALAWADFIKPRFGQISEVKATIIAKASVVLFGAGGCGVALLVSMVGGPLNQISGSLLAAFGGPLTGLFMMGCFFPNVNSKGALFGGVTGLILSSWLSLGKTFSKSVKRHPWLPPASTAMCFVNQTETVFIDAGSAMNYSQIGMRDFQSAQSGRYLNLTTKLMETTTAAVETGPQGVDIMYTMSYLWLAPVGILSTLVLGNLMSFLTGGNKKTPVNPRYLISIADHFCCFLPECLKKLIRCSSDDYATVHSSQQPPIDELFVDKEFIIPAITVVDPDKESSLPMIANSDLDNVNVEGDVMGGKSDISGGGESTGSSASQTVNAEDGDVTLPKNDADRSEKQEQRPAVDGKVANDKKKFHKLID